MKGFTLVEVMISVLILGLGLTVVINSYVVAARGLNSTANSIAAINLAKEKLNELEISSLKSGLTVSSARGVLGSHRKNYDYLQEVTEIAPTQDLAKYLVQACLSLSWKEQNLTKNVTLSTYLLKEKQ